MSNIRSKLIPSKFTSEERQKIFEEFTRLTNYFLKIANSENGQVVHSVNALLAYDWFTRLEFTLDSAGPLGGILDIFHPGIAPIELLRLEPLLAPETNGDGELSHRVDFFSHITVIAEHMLRIAGSSEVSAPVLKDVLSGGKKLTLQVSFALYGPVGCSLIIENGDGTVDDVITVAGQSGSVRLEFR